MSTNSWSDNPKNILTSSFLVFLLLLSGATAASAYSRKILSAYVCDIVHDGQQLYVATSQGLIVTDKQTGRQTVYGQSNQLHEDHVYCVTLHDGQIWAGQGSRWTAAITDGLATAFRIETPDSEAESWLSPMTPVSIIAVSADGTEFFALSDYLVVYKNGSTPSVHHITESMMEGCITQMKFDSQGTLWITSNDRNSTAPLCRYSADGGLDLLSDGISPTEKSQLGASCLAIDSNDNVWLDGGVNSIVRYDGEHLATFATGLSTGYFVGMEADAGQCLWAITNEGRLLRFDGMSITTYTLELQTGEEATCMDIDGDTIYIGTTHRLMSFRDGTYSEVYLLPDTQGVRSGELMSPTVAFSPYDLQGRCLTGHPAKGVYVEGGRVVVVR